MNAFKHIFLSTLLTTFVLLSSAVKADVLFTHEGDSITYDATNNHYILTYTGLQGEVNVVIWHPPTDVNVEVESEYKLLKDGMIEYEYDFKVAKTSKLAFDSFHLYALSVDKLSIQSPKQWRVLVRNSYEATDPTQRISWYTTTMQVQAGEDVDNFQFKSSALPVYAALYTSGKTETLSFIDYGPNVETQSYFQDEILAKHINGKAMNTAIPLIPVSEPFNPVETYISFHSFLQGYANKGFIDASLAASMMTASTTVLTALSANDVESALVNLKALKLLVEGEDGDHASTNSVVTGKPLPLIVKELRKILKFNLEFIKKKLTGEPTGQPGVGPS